MNIELKRNYGYELIFTAENVRITEDIEERIYAKREDGKTDFGKLLDRDINDEAVQQFVNILYEIADYRHREFDSIDLIEKLFERLPQEAAEKLVEKLHNDYAVDVEAEIESK